MPEGKTASTCLGLAKINYFKQTTILTFNLLLRLSLNYSKLLRFLLYRQWSCSRSYSFSNHVENLEPLWATQ